MNIPKNCSECPYTSICHAPHYGGSRCRYEKEIIEKTLKAESSMSKKIYINPGHSDKDPGAVGYEVERDLNERTAKYMNAYLRDKYVCELKKTPGTLGNLYDICKDANNWGADLFVSIHFNAGGGDGYEVYVYSEAKKPLGKIFEKQVKAIGQNSRGVKVQPGYVVLRNTKMPAVLNECAFVDNKKDIEDWNDDAELKKMGIAFAKAAAEYLNLEKKEKTVTVTFPVLSYGRKSDPAVKTMQALLKGYGYKVGPTGNFGKSTKAAVEAFQEANGLPTTGKMDEATWNALLGVK